MDEFSAWKARGPAGEYAFYAFGRDGEYSRPKVLGVNVLRHVHLAPRVDPHEQAEWKRRWRKGWQKTSDRVLVYAQDQTHGYLLIYILDEPGAHEIAEMRSPEDEKLMKQMAKVASDFIFDGSIRA
ncbi:hypothetical protein DBR23_03680 [Acidovorax sp. HMWF018]|nr:type II toxin-antitoxin system YafO family toxin [Acidovorax sp. HMWF018]PTT42367.1 hypothetical protein DBR23_03680 [Acidovorax sp. HMWF018]